jgi:hypothetical protein
MRLPFARKGRMAPNGNVPILFLFLLVILFPRPDPSIRGAGKNTIKNRNKIITLKGERLTVKLNDKVVIADTLLPGLPAKGAIVLRRHGDAAEFANLFVREL